VHFVIYLTVTNPSSTSKLIILYFEEELTKLLRELEDEHKKLNAIPSTKRMINFNEEDGFVTIR
jgi:hypothetical protein